MGRSASTQAKAPDVMSGAYRAVWRWHFYAGVLVMPFLMLLTLTGGFDIGPNASVYVDARNLTDERYVGEFSAVTDARSASTAVFFSGEGRSVFVGLRLAY